VKLLKNNFLWSSNFKNLLQFSSTVINDDLFFSMRTLWLISQCILRRLVAEDDTQLVLMGLYR
jgi:hypothetical protein